MDLNEGIHGHDQGLRKSNNGENAMIGNNEMKFNQETMLAAVQHYLEKIFTHPIPKVVEVKASGYDNYSEFTIKITSEEKEG